MASGILLMVVVAVTSAISAGQQQAYEAQQRIAATLAAEELSGRIVIGDYDALPSFHNHTENVGAMVDMNGQPMPELFSALGRKVTVQTGLKTFDDIDVKVRGREVKVTAYDKTGRVLAELVTFVPEPAEDSVPS
jgi:hypothetical protein